MKYVLDSFTWLNNVAAIVKKGEMVTGKRALQESHEL